ncbi:MAG: hypothetical protein WBK88_00300 [Methanothrix sp.]|jgi:hypothetical protein
MGEKEIEIPEVKDQTGGRSEFYREITPTSFWGGVRPGYIEAVAITTKVDAIEAMLHNRQVVEHTEEICLKLTPQQARSLVMWLLNHLKTYESIYGKIKTSEEVEPPKESLRKITYSEIDELLAR